MYGFKLFKVEFRRGVQGRTPVAVEKLDEFIGGSCLVHLKNSCNFLQRLGTLTGKPIIQKSKRRECAEYANRTGSPADPRILFNTAETRDSHTLRFTFQFGRVGSHAATLPAVGASSEDISEDAPSNPFRAKLLLPPEGQFGILAIETNGRTSPAKDLQNWLGLASLELAAVGKEQDFPGLGFNLTQLRDAESFKDILENADSVAVRLIKNGISPSSKRKIQEFILEQRILDTHVLGRMKDSLKKIVGLGNNQNENSSGSIGIVELQQYVEGDQSEVDFDEGYVLVRSGNMTTKISPDTVSDFFTYIISEERPTDKIWREAVEIAIGKTLDDLSIALPQLED